MKHHWLWALSAAVMLSGSAAHAEGVQVMVLGTYHFANPGKDIHNAKVDDVLAPQRQAEVAAATEALAAFAPTRIAVEMRADDQPGRTLPTYRDFLAGRRVGQRNEIDQIGFRLAQRLGQTEVYGIDIDGDFPFEALSQWAKGQGRGAELQQSVDRMGAQTQEFEQRQTKSSVGQLLRWFNEPEHIAADHGWYMQTLRYGRGAQQPGAELVAAWTARNLQICARLVQLARDGDRVLVVYGAGHAHLLRRCVQEQPGWQLVEPTAFLPR